MELLGWALVYVAVISMAGLVLIILGGLAWLIYDLKRNGL